MGALVVAMVLYQVGACGLGPGSSDLKEKPIQSSRLQSIIVQFTPNQLSHHLPIWPSWLTGKDDDDE